MVLFSPKHMFHQFSVMPITAVFFSLIIFCCLHLSLAQNTNGKSLNFVTVIFLTAANFQLRIWNLVNQIQADSFL